MPFTRDASHCCLKSLPSRLASERLSGTAPFALSTSSDTCPRENQTPSRTKYLPIPYKQFSFSTTSTPRTLSCILPSGLCILFTALPIFFTVSCFLVENRRDVIVQKLSYTHHSDQIALPTYTMISWTFKTCPQKGREKESSA